MSGMTMEHHQYVYQLYLDNPCRLLDGYVQELLNEFGLIVSNDIMQRWFMEIGPFKGTMWVASRFPSGRNSWVTRELLRQYLDFIVGLHDHTLNWFLQTKSQ